MSNYRVECEFNNKEDHLVLFYNSLKVRWKYEVECMRLFCSGQLKTNIRCYIIVTLCKLEVDLYETKQNTALSLFIRLCSWQWADNSDCNSYFGVVTFGNIWCVFVALTFLPIHFAIPGTSVSFVFIYLCDNDSADEIIKNVLRTSNRFLSVRLWDQWAAYLSVNYNWIRLSHQHRWLLE